MHSKDCMTVTDEYLSLYDEEEEGETEFHMVARITLDGHQYAVFEDPDDDEGLMVFSVEDADDSEIFNPVEDEDESERVFYLYEAAFDDYEFGNAI